MYTKPQRILNSKENLSNYVEDYDIYNSLLLAKLSDPNLTRISYQITVYEYRPDLIADEIYGSADYMGILMMQVATGLETYVKGTTISILPKATVDSIIAGI